MGHIVDSDREYRLLQKKLDTFVTGAPASPVLMKILKLLFSPEEAEMARQIPGRPVSLKRLAAKFNMPEDELSGKLTEMAQRGVVIDFEAKGGRYFCLPPVVIGFFEFTFMRTRNDISMSELAALFEEYMYDDDRFSRSVFQKETQVGRSLVREESLPQDGNFLEILDWERASHIVESASAAGVSLCPCRHHKSLLKKSCKSPQEVCLSLGYAAETLIRNSLARKVTINEAMNVLEISKEAGLAQTGDNVQKKVSYICNCCGCCCGMMGAIRTFEINNAIVTSNWIMEIDLSKCKGCGKCAKSCPVEAVLIIKEMSDEKEKKHAERNPAMCLGCGVCYSECKSGAISMRPRAQRVYTPETAFDLKVAMAIERDKLVDLLIENPENIGHRALGRILRALEKSSPYKAAMAVKPLRSVFMDMIVKGAKKKSGKFKEMFD